MRYIQRISSHDTNSFRGRDGLTFSRFMNGHYMGSSEFEWGTFGYALASIRENQMQLRQFSITSNNKKIEFWAICAEDDFPRLMEVFPALADGSRQTHERTDIDAHFRGEVRDGMADSWLVVDRHIHGRDTESPAIFFTKSRKMAARFYCEYMRTKILGDIEKTFDIRMFDQVRIPGYDQIGKVSGILENDAYVIKFQNKKTIRVALADIWPVSQFPSSDLHSANLLK
jgi:hypothetical protein